ncbi:hypothetical protein BpHYR1_027106 [Brachionus plicatilis]|uniref:Uncharacterized protein n=1 Tax=Brachionus plicatilis TaxID=10195 RepID=A0A3M7QHP6_BRAPC|nr:hypothetical protein BpHYR1_027106 [Brachionus plicatilis]
MFSSPRRVT